MKSKLRNSLQENKFVFTAETSPPDTGNKEVIIKKVRTNLLNIKKKEKKLINITELNVEMIHIIKLNKN